jgi:hypothetical protein
VPASDYQVDGVEKFYEVIEEILEEDGKREKTQLQ